MEGSGWEGGVGCSTYVGVLGGPRQLLRDGLVTGHVHGRQDTYGLDISPRKRTVARCLLLFGRLARHVHVSEGEVVRHVTVELERLKGGQAYSGLT